SSSRALEPPCGPAACGSRRSADGAPPSGAKHQGCPVRRPPAIGAGPPQTRRRGRPLRLRRRACGRRATRSAGHSYRAPLARRHGARRRPPSALPSCRIDDRSNLDRSVLARRAALRPGDGLVEAWGLHEEVAGELLFRVGIRAVEHFGLAVVLVHGRRRRTRLQSLAWRRALSFGERLIEGPVLRPEFFLRGRGERGLVVVNQQHEPHCRSLLVEGRVQLSYMNDERDPRISTGSPEKRRFSHASNARALSKLLIRRGSGTTEAMNASWAWIASWPRLD